MKELSEVELFDIITDLSMNPAARYAVKLRGWNRRVYPVQITLEDLWESQERNNYLFIAANSKKKPKETNKYPRAWDIEETKKKTLKVLKMTASQAEKFYTGLAKKRDPSITNEEVRKRNHEYNEKIKREEIKNGKHRPQE